jgi:multiple sugar transport system permease protein
MSTIEEGDMTDKTIASNRSSGLLFALKRVPWARILIWFLLIVMLVFCVMPLVFMVTASMMPASDIIKMPYRWIPRDFHVENYVKAIKGNDGSFTFPRNILNSLIVALTVAFTTVLLASLTG